MAIIIIISISSIYGIVFIKLLRPRPTFDLRTTASHHNHSTSCLLSPLEIWLAFAVRLIRPAWHRKDKCGVGRRERLGSTSSPEPEFVLQLPPLWIVKFVLCFSLVTMLVATFKGERQQPALQGLAGPWCD